MTTYALVALVLLFGASLSAQVETIAGPRTAPTWIAHGRVEGHLALRYSADGAISADSSLLAIVSEEKVVLMNLRAGDIHKLLKPHLPEIEDLDIHSADFLSSNQLLLLANGVFRLKGKQPTDPTPLLAFQWDLMEDRLAGKLNSVGAKGGFAPARYFPQIGHLGLYKDGNFDLWNPRTGSGGRIRLPDLTQTPNLFEFSPDGHWLLLAQIQGTSTADPTVVELKDHKFVDSLKGHEGTVLSMAFSRDGKKVATACEDGKVRVFSVGDWKPLLTLAGHQGPVHWAELSPNGAWIASVGEDHTLRIWSAEDGSLLQALSESQEPLLNVAFSPDSRFVVASSEKLTLVWQRQGGD